MKRTKRILSAAIALLLLLPLAALAEDSEVPYQTYTYDKWSNPTPTPNVYLPTRSIGGAQLGCGNFSGAQDLFYNETRHEIYLADAGNARILVLDEDFRLLREIKELSDPNGEAYAFKNPQGLFVQDDGTVYICDMGSQQVVVADENGTLLRILPTPESPLLPDNFNYLPTKIVVDANGRIYILSRGIYQGLIYLEPDGTFIKFFGANEVEMTLMRRMQKLWKSILSDKAAASMQSFNPIEYSNLFLSREGYIFATAAGSENGAQVLTRLNPLGINTLPWKGGNAMLLYSDVLERDGLITLLDANGGYLLEFATDGNSGMQITFGGIGQQIGLFQKPVSIAEINGNLYVLDAEKNTITEFELTDFGREIHEAIALYNQGMYVESIVPWEKVVRHNSNFLPAYTGLGKAYYQMHDYETAMYYFKLAGDRGNYSLAFKEHSLLIMRTAFPYAAVGLFALLIGVAVLTRIRKRRKEARHG